MKKGKIGITTNINEQSYAELQKVADKENRSKSAILRISLEEYLAKYSNAFTFKKGNDYE